MNDEFKKGMTEFKQGNYKKALKHFNQINKSHEDYEYYMVYKISCLIELKCYNEALEIINSLIAENPYDELLWFDKVTCHIFLKEEQQAYKAISELERIVDCSDKRRLVYLARFYNLLGDDEKALAYCNRALEIDGNLSEALHEKSLIAIRMGDTKMIDEIADKMLSISDRDILSLTPVFMLKLFAKNYEDCLNVIESSIDDEVKDETIEMFKIVIFKQISEDLNADLVLDLDVELPVDDALKVMFDFIDSGKNMGNVCGVNYMIV